MPLFCPKCGTQNSDWAQNCLQCSAPIPYRPAAPTPGSPGYGQTAPPALPSQQQGPAYGAPPFGSYQSQIAPYGANYAGSYPGHGRRFGAALLDGLIVCLGASPGGIILGLAMAIAAANRGESDPAAAALIILGMIALYGGMFLMALWNIYLLGRDGASLGKRWMGITVLDQNGQPLGFWKAFVREIVKGALGNLCFILLAWPLWDEQKQGLQDKIFNTHLFKK